MKLIFKSVFTFRIGFSSIDRHVEYFSQTGEIFPDTGAVSTHSGPKVTCTGPGPTLTRDEVTVTGEYLGCTGAPATLDTSHHNVPHVHYSFIFTVSVIYGLGQQHEQQWAGASCRLNTSRVWVSGQCWPFYRQI